MNRIQFLNRVPILCFLLLFSLTALAESAELRRGVIVDEAAGAAYLGAPAGGIEAVDLASGRSIWTSTDAALPLALLDGLLIAQAEEVPAASRLRIIVFDVQAGNRKRIEPSIALPEDVYALVADDLTRSFRATVERDGNGLLVSWTFKEKAEEGMARVRGEHVPARIVSGAAHVDLATGRAIAVPARRVGANAMPKTDARWRAGNFLATIEGGRGGPLTLKRWDAVTGAALPDRELSKKAVAALSSADRTEVLASERVGAGGPDDPEYRWSIFSVSTGERLGEIRRDTSASPFLLWNGTLVFEAPSHGYRTSGGTWIDEPLKIRGVRLSTGVPLWDRAIRDLRYRGTRPPAAPSKR